MKTFHQAIQKLNNNKKTKRDVGFLSDTKTVMLHLFGQDMPNFVIGRSENTFKEYILVEDRDLMNFSTV
jgi:hypothetical protein